MADDAFRAVEHLVIGKVEPCRGFAKEEKFRSNGDVAAMCRKAICQTFQQQAPPATSRWSVRTISAGPMQPG